MQYTPCSYNFILQYPSHWYDIGRRRLWAVGYYLVASNLCSWKKRTGKESGTRRDNVTTKWYKSWHYINVELGWNSWRRLNVKRSIFFASGLSCLTTGSQTAKNHVSCPTTFCDQAAISMNTKTIGKCNINDSDPRIKPEYCLLGLTVRFASPSPTLGI